MDLHLLVEAQMSVEQSHALAETVEHEVEAHFAHSNVTVHVEPCNGECEPNCVEGCLLTDEQRALVRAGGS
jgi:divalent metal cation (Fe/Co/Zn/Cd) transporter